MSKIVFGPVEVMGDIVCVSFNPVHQQAACSPDGPWTLTEHGWRMTGKGRWEGIRMLTCRVLSPVFVCLSFLHDPPTSPPRTQLQSPTGSTQCFVMEGLSNGSFLYPSPTKQMWQLFPLPRPGFILSLSGSEYVLSEWISLQTLLCACICVHFCQLNMD